VSETRLNDAPWLHSDALTAVVRALSDGDSRPRIVGGAVRDNLLGIEVADIDLATQLLPDEVTKRLEHAGIKAVPTGIDHGTITAVSQGKTFEITTLRRDVSTDGRRATVAFSHDWQEDAARRDFTINALYADPESGEIFDYFGGLADLEAHNIRFIGDASERIAEDHLRILRYFRFFARFGKNAPDEDAIAACAAAASSLMALSRERIADELLKLLVLPDPSRSVGLMLDHHIFAPFIPEVMADAAQLLKQLLEREIEADQPPVASRRLNAMLPTDPEMVDLVAARLKLSNRMRGDLAARLAELYPTAQNARALAYRHGVHITTDMFLLHGDDDWLSGVKQLHRWTMPILPIKGGNLVARGLTAGPAVAKTLQAIERQWIEEDFPDAERVNAIADQCVAATLSERKE
jgi:poly(A) polymerase